MAAMMVSIRRVVGGEDTAEVIRQLWRRLIRLAELLVERVRGSGIPF